MPFPKKKQTIPEDGDFDIEDIENYRGEPDLKFSHELLVMEQYRRTLKAGSQEMRKGWEERKTDRMGNIISVKTHPDTRKEFGECVKTLKNIMIGDVAADKSSKDSVPKLFTKLETLEKKYVDAEQKAWKEIPDYVKKYGSNWADRWEHIDGTLNQDHIFGEKYLQESVEVYREIMEEIGLLLYRMGYFKAERIED